MKQALMRRARTKFIKLNQSIVECKAKYLVSKPINFVSSSCIPTILSVLILRIHLSLINLKRQSLSVKL